LDFASIETVEGDEERTERYAKRGADVGNVLGEGVNIVLNGKEPSEVVSGGVVLVHDGSVNILDFIHVFGKFIESIVKNVRIVGGLVEGRKVCVGLIL